MHGTMGLKKKTLSPLVTEMYRIFTCLCIWSHKSALVSSTSSIAWAGLCCGYYRLLCDKFHFHILAL